MLQLDWVLKVQQNRIVTLIYYYLLIYIKVAHFMLIRLSICHIDLLLLMFTSSGDRSHLTKWLRFLYQGTHLTGASTA